MLFVKYISNMSAVSLTSSVVTILFGRVVILMLNLWKQVYHVVARADICRDAINLGAVVLKLV